MSGQTRSKKLKFSNTEFSLKNIPILTSFSSGSKTSYLCSRKTIVNVKKSHFKKVTPSHLPVFLTIAQPKIWYLLLWNSVCFIYMQLYDMYSVFCKTPKFWSLLSFLRIEILTFRVKIEIYQKIWYSHFRAFNLILLALWDCVLL